MPSYPLPVGHGLTALSLARVNAAADEWEEVLFNDLADDIGTYLGVSVPTGTGFRHIASGVEDAAAKLVETADVHANTIDPVAGTAGLRTLGTGAQQAAQGSAFASLQTAFGDHNTRHELGGADAIKLDDLALPDDTTDLNVTTSYHGLVPKAPGDAAKWLNGFNGGWAKVPGRLIRREIYAAGASGNHVPDGECGRLEVVMVAGGGGGGGAAAALSQAAGGSGGGAGAVVRHVYTSSPGTVAYAVGSGGPGGGAGNNAGTTGGNTTFGGLTANGGVGGSGQAAATGAVIQSGALGGVAAGSPDFGCDGDPGDFSGHSSVAAAFGGKGGTSAFGGGGQGTTNNAAGVNGVGFGSGGSGGCTSNSTTPQAGGNGAPGFIEVREYSTG